MEIIVFIILFVLIVLPCLVAGVAHKLPYLFHWLFCWEIEKGRNITHIFVECAVCDWRRCIVKPCKATGMSVGFDGRFCYTAPVDETWLKWIIEGQNGAIHSRKLGKNKIKWTKN